MNIPCITAACMIVAAIPFTIIENVYSDQTEKKDIANQNKTPGRQDQYRQIMQKIKSLALPDPNDFGYDQEEKGYTLSSITKQHYVFRVLHSPERKTIPVDLIKFENAIQITPLLKKLHKTDKNIIPVLIDEMDNTDFLFYTFHAAPSSSGRGGPRKILVNSACNELFFSIVYPVPFLYKSRKDKHGEYFVHPFFFMKNHLPKRENFDTKHFYQWWETNDHLSLKQIQLNMVDWHIEEEEKAGFSDNEIREHIMNRLLERKQEIEKSKDGYLGSFPSDLRYYRIGPEDVNDEIDTY